jgi:hypothetical protein
VRKPFVTLVFLVLLTPQLSGSDQAIGGIKLLDGYRIRKDWAVDASSWRIEKPGGLIIHFEAGYSEGFIVDANDRSKYAWFREQTINGNKVLLALVKPGMKKDPDLDKERNLPPGNVLLVTFPLPGGTAHAANFVGKIANSEEMVDMLLMVMTFDPSKGSF